MKRRYVSLAALAAFLALGGLPCHWAPPAAVAQAQGVPEVRVSLTEWALTPARIAVPAGRTIRFLAHNAGVLPHALAVEGPGVYAESPVAGSGDTARFELAFPTAGEYDLFCPVNAGEHRALGQEGVLNVLAGVSSLVLPRTGAPDPDVPPAASIPDPPTHTPPPAGSP